MEWRRRLRPALAVCVVHSLACPWAHADEGARHSPPRATDVNPWFGVTFAGFYVSRLAVPYSVGPELGAYLFRRLRLDARLLIPISQRDQCEGFDLIYPDETGPWYCVPSGAAAVAYNASVGYAVVAGEHWSFAPGLTVLGTDLAEPGVLLGLSAPVEWVHRSAGLQN